MDGTIDGPSRGSGLAMPGFKGLAWFGGALASLAAVVLGTVLVVVFAASLVVLALMGAGLVLFALLAARARRTLRKARAPQDGPTILEARNVGGHSWVAYGWDQGR